MLTFYEENTEKENRASKNKKLSRFSDQNFLIIIKRILKEKKMKVKKKRKTYKDFNVPAIREAKYKICKLSLKKKKKETVKERK